MHHYRVDHLYSYYQYYILLALVDLSMEDSINLGDVSVAVGALGEMSYCGRVAQAACLIEGNSQHYYHDFYHHCCRMGHYNI